MAVTEAVDIDEAELGAFMNQAVGKLGASAALVVIGDQLGLHERNGVGWHEHSHDLFEGVERFFRSGYNANLVDSWIRR